MSVKLPIPLRVKDAVRNNFGCRVFTRQELIDFMTKIYQGINVTSILPADWCIDSPTPQHSNNYKFLHWVERGKYRLINK